MVRGHRAATIRVFASSQLTLRAKPTQEPSDRPTLPHPGWTVLAPLKVRQLGRSLSSSLCSSSSSHVVVLDYQPDRLLTLSLSPVSEDTWQEGLDRESTFPPVPHQLGHLSVQIAANVDHLSSELDILVLLSEELLLAVHLHDLGNLDLGRHPGFDLGSIVATFKSLSGLLQVVCLVLMIIMMIMIMIMMIKIMIMTIITKRKNDNGAGTSSSMVALRVSGSRPATAPSGW